MFDKSPYYYFLQLYMKKFTVFNTLLFAVLLIAALAILLPTSVFLKTDSNIGADQVEFKDKEAEKHFPYDHLFFQRSYPDFEFDADVFRSALKEAKRTAEIALQQKDNEGFDTQWTLEGPQNIGGRINTVVSDPNDSNIIYVGCAKGGVFKTTDGGESWRPIFDDQLFLAISAIAIDPNDSNVLYVGTGDLNISGHFAIGDGVYKSVDGGETWKHLGLVEERIVSKILIHPEKPNLVYASCMGHPSEINNKRGVYRSKDGGGTWEQILFVAEDAGVIDMVMNWENPDVIYAAGWNRTRTYQESVTSGDDAKIFRTTDGGDTWEVLMEGLPTENMSRIGLAISPTNSNVLYSIYVSTAHELYGIFKTIDGGDTWAEIPTFDGIGLPSNPLGGFGWYFAKIGISPNSDDEIFLLGVRLYRTTDGGNVWERVTATPDAPNVHADKHSIFFPNKSTVLLATDGGLYKSTDDGITWEDIENIPNTQFYRVGSNPHNATYWGGAQDNGTLRGNESSINQWERVLGGDGFQVDFAFDNPNVVWGESQWGNMAVSTNGGDSFFYTGGPSDFFGDRVNWDAPYIVSRHNSDVVYAGTFRFFKSETGTNPTWTPISEDLTDGIIFGANFHTVTAIAESPISDQFLFAGTSDGNVWNTFDGGENWRNINHDLPDRYVTSIRASEAGTNLYVSHAGGVKGNSFETYIHRSIDFGESWEDISGDLPPIGINDVLTLPEDSEDQFLFAATDAGVYASLNAGENWTRIGTEMPYVFVFDIDYDQINRRLIAGTFARSIYSFPLDSIIDYGLFTNIESTETAVKNQLILKNNPVHSILKAEWKDETSSNDKLYEWRIYTIGGSQVLEKKSKQSSIEIEVKNLPNGTYLLQSNYGAKQIAKRFIKN